MSDELAPAVRRAWLALALIVGAALRLTSLLSLPIFNDEVIYALWARSILGGDWLISLSDGKLPLFYWLAAVAAGAVNDPLTGLRLTAALAGLAGIIGAYFAGTELAGRRAGVAAAWLYAIVPFMVVNDRLGLPDGLVAAAGPLIFLAAVRFGRVPEWRQTAALALVASLALLVKATAILLVLATVLGAAFGRRQAEVTGPAFNGAERPGDQTKVVAMGLAALLLALVPAVAVIVFGPSGSFVVGKSSSFLLNVADLRGAPYGLWLANLRMLSSWLVNYLQWPGLALVAVSLAVGHHRFKGRIAVALAAAAGPLAFMTIAARTWFSRYAVVAVPFLLLAVAVGFVALLEAASPGKWKRWAAVSLLAVATGVALTQDIALIKAPKSFAWTRQDRWQYINGWPAGYGFNAVVGYLRRRADTAGPGGITILVDRNAGFPRDGLLLKEIDKHSKLVDVDGRKHLPKILDERGTFLYVANEPRLDTPDFAEHHRRWGRVARFPKPGSSSAWSVYQWRFDKIK